MDWNIDNDGLDLWNYADGDKLFSSGYYNLAWNRLQHNIIINN
jgi:hypothetical protein